MMHNFSTPPDFVGHYGQTDQHLFLRCLLTMKELHHKDERDMPLLLEFPHDADRCALMPTSMKPACEAGLKLVGSMKKGLPRDGLPNERLLHHKRNTGCWSNEYLRFRWHEVGINE